jgi:hypothetical protein
LPLQELLTVQQAADDDNSSHVDTDSLEENSGDAKQKVESGQVSILCVYYICTTFCLKSKFST